MELYQGIFAFKLHEMEKAYGHLQSRLRICQRKDHHRIKAEIEKIRDESQESAMTLQRMIDNSPSRLSVGLARAQKEYLLSADRGLEELLSSSVPADEKAEAVSLFAEYAIDFAVLAMDQALLAALNAIDAQMTADEESDP